MADWYFKQVVNPNDTRGGGGCLATGQKAGEDCTGPWYDFFRVSTEFDTSPHAVICENHLSELWESRLFEDEQTEGDPLPIRDLPVERGLVSRD